MVEATACEKKQSLGSGCAAIGVEGATVVVVGATVVVVGATVVVVGATVVVVTAPRELWAATVDAPEHAVKMLPVMMTTKESIASLVLPVGVRALIRRLESCRNDWTPDPIIMAFYPCIVIVVATGPPVFHRVTDEVGASCEKTA